MASHEDEASIKLEPGARGVSQRVVPTLQAAPNLKARGDAVLAYTVITLALTLNFVTGYTGAYAMMAITLVIIIWAAIWRQNIWRLGGRPEAIMVVGAYGLLVVAFAITARQPRDLTGAVNFLYLPFFAPLSAFLNLRGGRRNLDTVALMALCGSVIAAGLALWQVSHLGMPRAMGWNADPIWSSDAAMITGFLAILGWYVESPLLPRAIYLLGPVLGTVVTVLSGSRGPLLVVPVLAVALILAGSRRRALMLGAGLPIVVLAAIGIYALWPEGAVRLNSIVANGRDLLLDGQAADGSVGARLIFWHIGWQAFMHSPVVGYGWAHFLEAAYAYLPDHGAAFNAGLYGLTANRHLHSDLLDIGVSAGIVGIAAYGLLLAAPVVGALRSPLDSQRGGRIVGALIVVIGYFGCGLTYLLFGFEFLTTLYVVIAATLVGFCQDRPVGTDG